MHRIVWMLVLVVVGCTDGADLRNRLSGRDPGPSGDAQPDARLDAQVDHGRLDQGGSADAGRIRDAALPVVDADLPVVDADLPVDARPPDATGLDARVLDAQMLDDAGMECSQEVCDERDNDCDGRIDEDAAGSDCQTEIPGQCSRGSTACEDGMLLCRPNNSPVPEVCDRLDNDCDGRIDEDFDGPEICNEVDDDCDGRVDENIQAGEECNGMDDDCDGFVDEGRLNACMQCGPTPPERCNGLDDNCDGRIDEGVCRQAMAYVIGADDEEWAAPQGLNAAEFVRSGDVDAAFATQGEEPALWAIVRGDLHRFDPRSGQWDAQPIQRALADFAPVDAAFATVVDPRRPERPKLTIVRDDRYTDFIFDTVRRDLSFAGQGVFSELFADAPGRPAAPYEAMVLQAVREPTYWHRGQAAAACDLGDNPAMLGVLAREAIFEAPVGCNRFTFQQAAVFWPAFQLAGTPDARRISGWAFMADAAQHVVFLKPARDGRGR
jgi:hypothetical protein